MSHLSSLFHGYIYLGNERYDDDNHIIKVPIFIPDLSYDMIAKKQPFKALVRAILPNDISYYVLKDRNNCTYSVEFYFNGTLISDEIRCLPYENIYKSCPNNESPNIIYTPGSLYLITYMNSNLCMLPISNISDVVRTDSRDFVFPNDIRISGIDSSIKELFQVVNQITGGINTTVHLDEQGNLIIPGDYKTDDGSVSVRDILQSISTMSNQLNTYYADITDLSQTLNDIKIRLDNIINNTLNNCVIADEDNNIYVNDVYFNSNSLDSLHEQVKSISVDILQIIDKINSNTTKISSVDETIYNIDLSLSEYDSDILNLKQSVKSLQDSVDMLSGTSELDSFLRLNDSGDLNIPEDLVFNSSGLSDIDLSSLDVLVDEYSSKTQSLVGVLRCILTSLKSCRNSIISIESQIDRAALELKNSIQIEVSNHNTSNVAHSDIRDLISSLTTRLNALADSDDTTLDQLSEIVAYIKSNRTLIESITTSKVDKVSGKDLSTNDYTTIEKDKLSTIASGAEVNVQSDWNVTDNTDDAFIKNKPTIPTVGNGTVTITQNGTNKGSFTMNQSGNATIELTDSNTTYTAATQSSDGLMSVSDKRKLDGISSGANLYSLPLATSSARGGVKIGYAQNGKNYPVQLKDEQMYVNVPWTDTNTTYELASSSKNGLMSASDKVKMDTIASGAQVNQNAFSSLVVGSSTIFSTSASDKLTLVAGSNITLTADITNRKITIDSIDTKYSHPEYLGITSIIGLYNIAVNSSGHVTLTSKVSKQDIVDLGIPDTNTWVAFKGSTTTTAGISGYVPGPSKGSANRYFRSDGVWAVPPNTTYNNASQSVSGLMSASDKLKLDSLANPIYLGDSNNGCIRFPNSKLQIAWMHIKIMVEIKTSWGYLYESAKTDMPNWAYPFSESPIILRQTSGGFATITEVSGGSGTSPGTVYPVRGSAADESIYSVYALAVGKYN